VSERPTERIESDSWEEIDRLVARFFVAERQHISISLALCSLYRYHPGMGMSAHRRMILLACRPGAAAKAEMRELASGPLDWRELALQSHELELEALVSRRVDEICGDLLPAEVGALLHRTYRRNLGRNLALGEKLAEILDLFAEAGIPALALKGPVLAETAYGHPGLRKIYDLDLLVRRSDVRKAFSLLVARGYRSHSKPPIDLDAERDVSLVREAVIELHWKLKDRFLRLPETALWEDTRELRWNGRTISGLSNELLLLQLVHHLHYHAHPLKILVDVGRVIERSGSEIDWQRVGELARGWKMQRNLHLALEAVSRVLDQDLPTPARDLCQETAGGRWWLRSLILNPRWYFSRRAQVLRADAHLRSAFSALSIDGSATELMRTLAGRGGAKAKSRTQTSAAPWLHHARGLAAGFWRMARPGMARPGMARPGMARPDAARPDAASRLENALDLGI